MRVANDFGTILDQFAELKQVLKFVREQERERQQTDRQTETETERDRFLRERER